MGKTLTAAAGGFTFDPPVALALDDELREDYFGEEGILSCLVGRFELFPAVVDLGNGSTVSTRVNLLTGVDIDANAQILDYDDVDLEKLASLLRRYTASIIGQNLRIKIRGSVRWACGFEQGTLSPTDVILPM